MHEQVEAIAHKLLNAYRKHDPRLRFLVGIAGPPGSGKSTLILPLTTRLNALLKSTNAPVEDVHDVNPDLGIEGDSEGPVICVSLDGWHYTRKELDRFEDPVKTHYWRGAAFTFDLPSYTVFLHSLAQPLDQSSPIQFPTFSHSAKDPAPSPCPILPTHLIVIIEGLYTHLSTPGWRECAEMLDFKIWIDVDEEAARKRLVRRNHEAGIVKDWEACVKRVNEVDMENGEVVRANRVQADALFESVDQVERTDFVGANLT